MFFLKHLAPLPPWLTSAESCASDTELKEKWKLLEARITAINIVIEDNDATIKNRLQILESVIRKNDTTIKDKLQTL